MNCLKTLSLIALLVGHPLAYAEVDRPDSEETKRVNDQLFTVNDFVGGSGATSAYDWSYSNSMLLAANSVVAQNSMAAQSGSSGSGNSSASSDDDGPPQAHRYATLGDRKKGEHVKDEDGNDKIWPHKLPFLGQKVTSMGYDLPNPYGVAVIGSYIDQALQISNLRVSTSGTVDGPYVSVDDFVSFGASEAQALAIEAKYDFWLWPFLNVFVVAGKLVDGQAVVPLTVGIEGALDFLGLGAICPDNPPIPSLRPDFCDQSVPITAEPEYDGTNVGVGIVLAGGWKHYFVAIPLTYVYSDLSNLKDNITTFNAEILLGRTFKMKHPERQFELFIGGNYLDATQEIKNSIILPLSDTDPSLPDVEIFYEIHEVNKDKWNYIFGGNFQINRRWDLAFQVGFGGSRDQGTLTATYRW
jgi:hypothetical protein